MEFKLKTVQMLAITYKNNKKYTEFVKKLLTSVLDVVNITELLGKPQDTQLGNI